MWPAVPRPVLPSQSDITSCPGLVGNGQLPPPAAADRLQAGFDAPGNFHNQIQPTGGLAQFRRPPAILRPDPLRCELFIRSDILIYSLHSTEPLRLQFSGFVPNQPIRPPFGNLAVGALAAPSDPLTSYSG